MKNILLTILLVVLTFGFSGCEKKDAHFDDFIKFLVLEPLLNTMDVNTSQKYEAIAIYESGKKELVTESVTWSVEDTSIATINENGILESKSIGRTLVIATLDEKKGEAVVVVRDKILEELNIYPATSSIYLGTTQNYRVIARYKDGSVQNVTMDVVWDLKDRSNIISKYSDDDEAKKRNIIEDVVLPFATAKGDIVGNDTLLATFEDQEAQAYVEVVASKATDLVISPKSQTVLAGTSTQFDAVLYHEDGSVQDVTNVVSWSSSTPGIASIEEQYPNTGNVNALSAGTTVISASYDGLTDSTDFRVNDIEITKIVVLPIDKTIALGLDVQYQALAYFNDDSFQDISSDAFWASSNETIATISNISQKGLATTLSKGSTEISATYDNVSGSTSLNVIDATVESLSISPSIISTPKGTKVEYTATLIYSDSSDEDVTNQVTWISQDNVIVSIDTDGVAQALNTGITSIEAKFDDITSNSAKIIVTDIQIKRIDITPVVKSVASGTELQYSAIAVFTDNSSVDITSSSHWQSSDTTVATIDESGLARTETKGLTSIKATYDSLSSINARLNVTEATVDKIVVTPKNIMVPAGTTGNLQATAYYSDGSHRDVTQASVWVSSDDSVVYVKTQGEDIGGAQALKAGKATVTANFEENSDSIEIEVTNAVLEKIVISPVDERVALGVEVYYTAIGIFSDNTHKDITMEVDWKVADEKIVSLEEDSAKVWLRTVGTGYTTLNASLGSKVSNTATIVVTNAEMTSIDVTPVDITVPVGTSGYYKARANYTDGSSQDVSNVVTWESSKADVVSITSGGFAEALKAGDSTIKAYLSGIVSNEVKVQVVEKQLVSIHLIPASVVQIAKGETQQYSVLAYYDDNSTKDITQDSFLSTKDTTIATIEVTGEDIGLAHGVNVGKTSVKALFEDKESEATLIVTPATLQIIQIEPAEITIPVGTKGTFIATGYYSDNSSSDITSQCTWLSSDSKVVNVVSSGDSAGYGNALQAGVAEVTATLGSIVSNNAKITVEGKTLDNVQITPNNASYVKGSKKQYTVYAIYTDYTSKDVTAFTQIQSLDRDVAIFDENNIVTTTGVGSVELTTVYEGMTSEREFLHVTEPDVESIKLTPSQKTMDIGDKQEYIALASFSDGSSKDVTLDVSWSSTDRSVALGYIENSKAIAEGIEEGSTTITASLGNINSNDASLNISSKIESISIEPLDETISSGSTLQYSAFAHYTDGKVEIINTPESWLSADTTVATINSNGLASALTFGETIISVYYSGMSASTTLGVIGECGPPVKPSSIFILPANATLSVATQMQYELWGLWDDGCSMFLDRNEAQNWSSGDESIITIGKKDGVALGVSNGKTVINAAYQSLTTHTNVEVLGGEEVLSVSIQPAPTATLSKGATQVYLCSARTVVDGIQQPEKWVTGQATFSSSNQQIASIGSNDGTRQYVIAKNKAGTTTITCHYGGKNSSSKLTVE